MRRTVVGLGLALISLVATRQSAAQALRVIYVPDRFPQQGADLNGSGPAKSLGELFAELVVLGLQGVPELRLAHWNAPRCTTPEASGLNRPDVAGQVSAVPDTPVPESYYFVDGHLRVGQDAYEVSYRVVKCERGHAETVMDRSETFRPGAVLDRLTGAARYVSFTVSTSLPKTSVALTAFDSTSAGLRAVSNALRDRIADSLVASGKYQVSDTAAGGEYRLEGHLRTTSGGIGATLRIRAPDQKHVFTSPEILGVATDSEAFAGRVAAAALLWLDAVQMGREFGADLLKLNADTLARYARRLLCDGVSDPCAQDVDRAQIAAQAAVTADSLNWEAWRVNGEAQLRESDLIAAYRSLRRADSLLARTRAAGGGVTDSAAGRLARSLGDVYFAFENYESAIGHYDRARRLNPRDAQAYLGLVRSLRLAGRDVEAWNGIQNAVEHGVPIALFDEESLALLRESEPSQVADSIRPVIELCRERGHAQRQIAAECIDALFHAGRRLYNASGDTSATRTLFRAVLDLRPPDSTVLEAYAFLGGGYLGSTVFNVTERGCLRIETRRFSPDSANKYLTLAERAGRDVTLDRYTREWLTRLRALYLLQRRDFSAADSVAQEALRVVGTNQGRFVAVRIAFARARLGDEAKSGTCRGKRTLTAEVRKLYERAYQVAATLSEKRYEGSDWYLREAGNALGRDEATARMFERLARQSPEDLSALRNAYFVYGEYLHRFDSAFSAVERLKARGGLTDPPGAMDATEVALRVGQYDSARVWIAPADSADSAQALELSERVVLKILRAWLAVGTARPAAFRDAFEQWRQVVEKFRATRDVLGWTFRGSEAALPDVNMDRCYKNQLLSMFRVSQDDDRQLPVPEFTVCRPGT